MTSKLARATGPAALAISLLALVLSMSGASFARKDHAAAKKTRVGAVVRLDSHGRVPVRLIPKVKLASNADALGGQSLQSLTAACAPSTVDMGTWCLDSAPYSETPEEVGKNNYAFATQKCVSLGGYLPTAAQLIGAAGLVKLNSTIDDNATTANIAQDPSVGLKDKREMSATLVTTRAGSSAAGSEGVTQGSKGNPKTGEPDPVPQPADPAPDTLQYVTVYDNHDKGGFAGAQSINRPEDFRCAYNKQQGAGAAETG